MKSKPSIAILIILVICLGLIVKHQWKDDKGNAWRSTINSDGYGYYAYLPSIFIYHHLDYKRAYNEEIKIRPEAINFATPLPQNGLIDKYFVGVALLLTPFFLIAYLISYLAGYGTGGYEFLFQVSVSVGALFYLTVGLVFICKLLKAYNISDFIVSITVLCIVLGTNLFYYATIEPSMSHVYSFGLTAVFLFFSKKSIDDFSLRNLVPMIASISVLTLIRPTNLLSIAFIPVMVGDSKKTASFTVSFFNKKSVILVFIALAILCIQCILWYMQTGNFIVWSYPNEGFNFKEFHFFDILFSYRKGWFIYTPIMFIAVFGGLIALYRQSGFRFFSGLLFFVLVTYILSSWWAWWYGGSFGLRAFIDFYPAFALLLALFINSLTAKSLKRFVLFLAFLCIGLNLFQTKQYINNILPWDGMTKEKYWKIFLKNKPSL